MAIEVRQMVVKSDIKTSEEDSQTTAVNQSSGSGGGAQMNCNQSQTVVVEDCMRQIKRMFDTTRER